MYSRSSLNSLMWRTQIPPLPGRAITIHKSRGMTIDRLVISLDDCFERGQAYVVLSRARSLRGLKVLSLPKDSVASADRTVLEFYKTTFDRNPVVSETGGSEWEVEDEHGCTRNVRVNVADAISAREGDISDVDGIHSVDERILEALHDVWGTSLPGSASHRPSDWSFVHLQFMLRIRQYSRTTVVSMVKHSNLVQNSGKLMVEHRFPFAAMRILGCPPTPNQRANNRQAMMSYLHRTGAAGACERSSIDLGTPGTNDSGLEFAVGR